MINNKTYETIRTDVLSRISDMDKREGSFISDMISPLAMELEGCYQSLYKLIGVMFLEDCKGEYIERRAGEYGIKRKNGTAASGYVTFTGIAGAMIPLGSLVATAAGLLFETSEVGGIPSDKTEITVPIRAQHIGEKYNISIGTITQIPLSLLGIVSVCNLENITGGADIETDAALLERVLFMLQRPATSGNSAHYKLWALEVSGVGDAKIFPLYNGNGTVMIMPITATKRKPDPVLINRVLEHIESKRPLGASVSVMAPVEVPLHIVAVVEIGAQFIQNQVKEAYEAALCKYIETCVYELYIVDYYKCLAMLYEIAGVLRVVEFTLNGGVANIEVKPTEIQVVGSVAISVRE